jgi:hypothetical protein
VSTDQSKPGEPLSEPLPAVARITRKDAATGQLETAILLWFYERDIASIHTLAVAAQGILDAIGREMGARSKVVTWISSRSKSFQEKIRNPQNFFKHGHHKQRFKDRVSYTPEMAELFMIDAIALYQELFHSLTPLMILFAMRFSISHPKGLPFKALKVGDATTAERLKIENITGLGREEFFEKVLPLIIKRR